MYTIEKEYLLDLEDSIESIFEIDGDLGKKFDYKAKDLQKILLEIDPRKDINYYTDNHPFSTDNFYIANKAVYIYTMQSPVYKILNKILRNQDFKKYPQLYPLANTISCGLINFNDVNGNLQN